MTDIEVEQFFAHSPAKVWRALTEPDLIAAWLMPNDFQPRVGHRYTLQAEPVPATGFDGVIQCEVLSITTNELLAISWRSSGLDSTVTWALQPEGTGTRMLLTHAGFDPDDPSQLLAFQIMNGGWRSHILTRLTKVLAQTGSPREPAE